MPLLLTKSASFGLRLPLHPDLQKIGYRDLRGVVLPLGQKALRPQYAWMSRCSRWLPHGEDWTNAQAQCAQWPAKLP